MTASKPTKPRPRAGTSSAFAAAIRAALAERDDGPDGAHTRLDRVAQTLVGLAVDGNMAAIKEISDRLDGKAGALQAQGAPSATPKGPIEVRVKWLKD